MTQGFCSDLTQALRNVAAISQPEAADLVRVSRRAAQYARVVKDHFTEKLETNCCQN
jgi:hypothetical protein